MQLKAKGQDSIHAVAKLEDRQKVCILNALYNVGHSKMKKAVAACGQNGPLTYATVQMHLVAMKTGQYICESNLDALETSLPDSRFLLHWRGHAVGVEICPGGALLVSDDAYACKFAVTYDAFRQVANAFRREAGAETVVVYKLETGAYNPTPFPAAFYLNAGGPRQRKCFPAAKKREGQNDCAA